MTKPAKPQLLTISPEEDVAHRARQAPVRSLVRHLSAPPLRLRLPHSDGQPIRGISAWLRSRNGAPSNGLFQRPMQLGVDVSNTHWTEFGRPQLTVELLEMPRAKF